MMPRKFERIADDLGAELQRDPQKTVPSVNDLAERYDVSYQTMWKAMQVLVAKGLIATGRGKKTAVSDGDGAPRATSSADGLFAKIKDRILAGDYRAGFPLPKVGYFVHSEHVADTTVTRALRRLAAQGLVHARKRRWVAGPSPEPGRSRSGLSTRTDFSVVIYLHDNQLSWSKRIGDAFGGGFQTPFTSELLARGIVVAPCLRSIGSAKGIPVPAGMDQVMEYIRGLGSSYAGTLTESMFPREDGLEDWIPRLLKFGKPVIYFDFADRGRSYTRQWFSAKKLYYRLYQDEETAVAMALDALSHRGHTGALVHGSSIDSVWAQRRAQRIREQAARMEPPVRISECPEFAPWLAGEVFDADSMMLRLARKAGIADPFDESDKKALSRFRQLLLRESSALVSALMANRPTALIALNDFFAREYYFWIKALGGQAPRDLSLVSFDNHSDSAFFGLSTIDWGFTRLGYLAAHILIGDIPVRADRNGFIAGPCTLVDRGSIAPPGKAKEAWRWLRHS